MRFASKDSKTPCNCNVQEETKHIEAAITVRTTPSLGRTQPAPAADTRYLSSPAATTWHGKTQGFVLRLPAQNEAHATFMQPLQCVLQAKIPKHHVTAMYKKKQNTSKQPLQCWLLPALGRTQPAPAAHMRYLSSPAATTWHGKTQGFVPRLPAQNEAHATFLQPLHCDLQPESQQTHRITHTWTTTLWRTCDVNFHTILHWV